MYYFCISATSIHINNNDANILYCFFLLAFSWVLKAAAGFSAQSEATQYQRGQPPGGRRLQTQTRLELEFGLAGHAHKEKQPIHSVHGRERVRERKREEIERDVYITCILHVIIIIYMYMYV